MSVKQQKLRQSTLLLVLACGSTHAVAQLGEPTPILTTPEGATLVDPFGGVFLPPATGPIVNRAGWPGQSAAGANFWFQGVDQSTGEINIYSDFAFLDSSESGPFGFSASRHDKGDIGVTFGLARPNDPLSYVNDPFYAQTDLDLALTFNGQTLADDGLGHGEIRAVNGPLSLNTGGLPTYAWKPDVSQGVMLIQGITNGYLPIGAAPSPAPRAPRGDISSQYRALVLGTTGLQNYWSFEDAAPGGMLSGAVDSAGSDDGTVVGSVESEPGLVGNTAYFPGDTDNETVNNVIEITGSDMESRFDLQGSFTVEALVRFTTIPERFAGIITKGDDSWRLSPDGSNPYFEPSANGLSGSTTNTVIPFADGEWHYVAFVVDFDAGTQSAYVDGTVATESFADDAALDLSDAMVLIGGNAQKPEREWQGNIDEVAIYNTALTPEQIEERVELLGTSAVEVPPVYTLGNVVANSADRTGVGFSMVNGKWGDSNSTGKPNAMRLQVSAFGDLGEACLPVGLAWFPYEQGFIGGYHTPKGLEYRNPPIFFDDTAENTGAVTDPAAIERKFVLPAQETIGGRTIQWRREQVSGVTEIVGLTEESYTADLGFTTTGITSNYALLIEGSVVIPDSDTYFFGMDLDDSGLLDIYVDGEWVTIAGRRNTGGVGYAEGSIDLAAGTYPVRVRYVQRGGGGTLSLYLDNFFTFQEPLEFAGSGATVSLYDLELLSPRSDRYIGLVDEDSDGQADYGLGTWRVEDLARASCSDVLIDYPEAVKYLADPDGSSENGLHGRVRFDLPGATPSNSMLFVQGTESSSAPVWAGLMPPQQGDTSWEAHLRRSNTNQVDTSSGSVLPRAGAGAITGLGSGGVGFVAIPYNANNLVGGYVLGDGSIAQGPTGQGGNFEIIRTAEGTYELEIPGRTGADGVVMLMPVGQNDLGDGYATRALFSNEYDSASGKFIIESRVWNPGDDGNGGYSSLFSEFPLTDSGFYFVFVDFENPLTLSNSCSTADLAEPFGVLNFFDVSEFLTAFSAQSPSVDFNNDGLINFFDVSEFLLAYNAGCP